MATVADRVKKAQDKMKASSKKATTAKKIAEKAAAKAKKKAAKQTAEKAAAKTKKKAAEKKAAFEEAKKAPTSKMTSTERARHTTASDMAASRDYFDYTSKTRKYGSKVDDNKNMTSTEKARHKASQSMSAAYDDYRKSKKEAEKARDARDQWVRKSYEQRRKAEEQREKLKELERLSSGEYAHKRNPAAVRGMNYSGDNYYAKQYLAGAESLAADTAKAIQADRELRKGSKFIGDRPSAAITALQKDLQKQRDDYTDSNNLLKRYTANYDKRLDKLNSDVRADSLGSKLAFGAGRLTSDLALAALDPTPVGELKMLAKAPKAIRATANMLKTPANKPARLLSSTGAYYGNRYDEARKAGADPETASKAAALYAAPQAYIEGLGGAEKVISSIAKPGTSIAKTMAKSGVSEAIEEASQTPWESGSRRFYGADIPLYSTTENAIINPREMGESALIGGILGAAGGGPASVRAQMEVGAYRNEIRNSANAAIENVVERVAGGSISEEAGRIEIDIIRRQAAEEEAALERAVGNAARDKNQAASDDQQLPNWRGNVDDYDGYYIDPETEAQERLLFEQQGIDYDAMSGNYSLDGPDATPSKVGGRYVRGGARTQQDVLSSDHPEVADEIERLIDDGDERVTYSERYSDVKAFDEAAKSLDEYEDIDAAVVGVMAKIGGSNYDKGTAAEVAILVNESLNAGRNDLALSLMLEDDRLGTEVARLLQSRTMLRKLTPAGRTQKAMIDASRKEIKNTGVNLDHVKRDVEGEIKKKRGDCLREFIESDDDKPSAARTRKPRGKLARDIARKQAEGKGSARQDIFDRLEEDADKHFPQVWEWGNPKENSAPQEMLSVDRKAEQTADKIGNWRQRTKILEEYPNLPASPQEIKAILKEGMDSKGIDIEAIIIQNDPQLEAMELAEYVAQRLNGTVDAQVAAERREMLRYEDERQKQSEITEDDPGIAEEESDEWSDDDLLWLDDQVSSPVEPRVDVDEFADLVLYIEDGIKAQTIRRRDAILRKMLDNVPSNSISNPLAPFRLKNRGTGKKRSTLKKLIMYNNLGVLDDPEAARILYDGLNVPYFTNEEIGIMSEIYSITKELEADPELLVDPTSMSPETLEYIGEDRLNRINNMAASYRDKIAAAKLKNERKYAGDQEKIAVENAIAEQTTHGRDDAIATLEALAQDIATNKVHSNAWQKIRQLQITSLLGNAKTMMRNILPNMAMLGVNQVGRPVGALADAIASKSLGTERQMGAHIKPSEVARNVKSFGSGARSVYRDARTGVDTNEGDSNKMEVGKSGAFSDGNPFGRAVNSATRAVSLGLQLGDRPFRQMYKDQAIADYMRLNNVTEVDQNVQDLIEWEALTNVFMDENAATEFVQRFVSTFNFGREFGIGSILQPFVKAPTNIVRLIWYYSPPSGIAQVVNDGIKLKRARTPEEQAVYQRRLALHTSNVASGAFIWALLFLAAAIGDVEFTAGDDDEYWADKRYKSQVHGHQEWSLRIGDRYIGFGALAPIGQLIAQPVAIHDSLKNGDNAWGFSQGLLAATIMGLYESNKLVYDQTMFKTLQDLFKYRDVVDAVAGLLASASNQFIPTLVRQTASTIDPWQRNTASDKDNVLFAILDSGAKKLMNSVPGLSMLLPEKTDPYGFSLERYDLDGMKSTDLAQVAYDMFNAYINPFSVSRIKKGNFYGLNEEVAEEYAAAIELLEELDIQPKGASGWTDVGDDTVKMDGAAQADYNYAIGRGIVAEAASAMSDPDFNALSREDKKKILDSVADDISKLYAMREEVEASFKTKKEALEEFDRRVEYFDEFKAANAAFNHGFSLAEYHIITNKINEFEGTNEDGDKAAEQARKWLIAKDNLTDDQKLFIAETNTTILSKEARSKMYTAVEATNMSKMDYLNAYMFNRVEHIEGEENQKYVIELMGMLPASGVEAWYAGTKHTGGSALNGNGEFGLDEFIAGYKAFLDVADGARRNYDKSTAVNRLNISVAFKRALLAANDTNPDSEKCIPLTEGGDIEIADAKALRAAKKGDNRTFTEKLEEYRRKINQSKGMTRAERERRIGSMEVSEYYREPQLTTPTGADRMRKTGNYGENRGDHMHNGIDIGVYGQTDASANSVVSGKVVRVETGYNGGYGNMVIIQGDDGWAQVYAHLDSIADGLETGKTVKAGQQIGVVGSTGHSTGTHLHFEVRRDPFDASSSVDPETVYDIFGDGIKTASSDPDYRPSSKSKKTSSGSSGGGSKKKGSGSGASSKPAPKTGVRSYGSYSFGSSVGDTFDYSGYTGYGNSSPAYSNGYGSYTYGGYDYDPYRTQ